MATDPKKISNDDFLIMVTANKSNETIEGISTIVNVGLSAAEKAIYATAEKTTGLLSKVVSTVGKIGNVGTGLEIIGDALQKTDLSTPNLQNEFIYIDEKTANKINETSKSLGKSLSEMGRVLNPIYLAGTLAEAYGYDKLGEVLKNNSTPVEILATATKIGQANGASYTSEGINEEALAQAKEQMSSYVKPDNIPLTENDVFDKANSQVATYMNSNTHELSIADDAKKNEAAVAKEIEVFKNTIANTANVIAQSVATNSIAPVVKAITNVAKKAVKTTTKPLGSVGTKSQIEEEYSKNIQAYMEEAKKMPYATVTSDETKKRLEDISMNNLLTYDMIGKFAVGTPYIPKDMIALVHEGEMIVPKSQNPYAGANRIKAAMNASSADVAAATANNTSNITYTFNSPKALGMSEILREMRLVEQRKALLGV